MEKTATKGDHEAKCGVGETVTSAVASEKPPHWRHHMYIWYADAAEL